MTSLRLKISGIFAKDDLKEQAARYGEIKTSILAYITPVMIFTATVILLIVAGSFESLYRYFETNVALNGLIIFTGCYALWGTFNNNYQLYQSAKILSWIDAIMAQEDLPTPEQMHKLRWSLDNKAALLNTKHMFGVLDKVEEFGAPKFSDLEARLIKSKLGYRVRINRSDVGFLAGILVMLGLLGTFLGLLKTIDAVGEAMASMSNIGAGGSEVGIDEMSSFIGRLAEPLQGMGLAFSSSLFGLSSSLLTGFFNHLGGGAQNQFIEDVSRWIDDRIPKFEPKAVGVDKDEKFPSGDDLKTWLAGFVYLAVKTNRKMSKLVLNLTRSNEVSLRSANYLEDIATTQKDANNALERMDAHITDMTSNQREIGDRLQGLSTVAKGLQDISDSTRNTANTLSTGLALIHENMSARDQDLAAIPPKMSEFSSVVKDLGIAQKALAGEIERLNTTITASANNDQTSAMAMQLSSLLEELSTKNEEAFFNLFSEPKPKDDSDDGGSDGGGNGSQGGGPVGGGGSGGSAGGGPMGTGNMP